MVDKYFTPLNLEKLEQMDLAFYRNRFQELEKAGKVCLIPERNENFLANWLKNHYKELGFEAIVKEYTQEYEKLRLELGFSGQPDFLVREKEQWLRLELETLSHLYRQHPQNFADIVFCIQRTSDLPLRTLVLEEILGCEVVIEQEIFPFLYENDSEFRTDYLSRRTLIEDFFSHDTRVL